jgi:hypothetical protein
MKQQGIGFFGVSWCLAPWPAVGALLACTGCGGSASSTNAVIATGNRVDASTGESGTSSGGAIATDGAEGATSSGGTPATTPALVRLANLAPDSPASGYDACLAPTGTYSWRGPLLAQYFDAGAIGQGGPNGIQFPYVTAYMTIPPGQYDVVLVAPGDDCSSATLSSESLLTQGSATTLAVIGKVRPNANDAPLQFASFSDDTTAPSGVALLRFINADPSVAAAAMGTGKLANNNFVPLFPDTIFGWVSPHVAQGLALDSNRYATVSTGIITGVSAHALGATTDLATATHPPVSPGTATTLMLINGAGGARLRQILACTDSAGPVGALSPCKVLISE